MFGSYGKACCVNRYCLLQIASFVSFCYFLTMLFDLTWSDNRRLFGRWPWIVPRLCKSWLFSTHWSSMIIIINFLRNGLLFFVPFDVTLVFTWHYWAAIWKQAGYIHKLNQMLVEHDPAVCIPAPQLQSKESTRVHTVYLLPDPVAKLLLLPSSNSQALVFGQLPKQSERFPWFVVEFYWIPAVISHSVRLPPLFLRRFSNIDYNSLSRGLSIDSLRVCVCVCVCVCVLQVGPQLTLLAAAQVLSKGNSASTAILPKNVKNRVSSS